MLFSELFLINSRGKFLDRAVHTNHEISTRRSRFNICFEKHGMVFPRISFQSSQTERFLVGYCEKELRRKHAQKKQCLGTSCLRRLVTGDMETSTSKPKALIYS